MSNPSEILEGFFEAEYHNQKRKQITGETQKELLEYRIRFLKRLLDEMQALEHKLTDKKGEPPSGEPPTPSSNGDEEDHKKKSYTIERLCACEELIENELQELSDILKFVKMKYEHASERIEDTSMKICKIQNGGEVASFAEMSD